MVGLGLTPFLVSSENDDGYSFHIGNDLGKNQTFSRNHTHTKKKENH